VLYNFNFVGIDLRDFQKYIVWWILTGWRVSCSDDGRQCSKDCALYCQFSCQRCSDFHCACCFTTHRWTRRCQRWNKVSHYICFVAHVACCVDITYALCFCFSFQPDIWAGFMGYLFIQPLPAFDIVKQTSISADICLNVLLTYHCLDDLCDGHIMNPTLGSIHKFCWFTAKWPLLS